MKFLAGVTVVVALSFSPIEIHAQALTESSWEALTNDASRQSLFDENVIPAKLLEDEKEPKNDQIIGLAIPKDFVFPDDAKYDKIQGKDRDNTIFGIDISHYTGSKITFANLNLQRVRFVYAKATQGLRYKDAFFGAYWSDLSKLQGSQKLYRGAYHFLTADEPGEEQAKKFVEYVNLHGGIRQDDMPPCLDLEWDVTPSIKDRWTGHAPQEILQNALDWMKTVKQQTGRTPMLYTALSWWRERGIPESDMKLFDSFPIWIADYSKSHKATESPALIGSKRQSLWQFASDARLTTGYPGGSLDANIYYGTADQFEKEFDIRH